MVLLAGVGADAAEVAPAAPAVPFSSVKPLMPTAEDVPADPAAPATEAVPVPPSPPAPAVTDLEPETSVEAVAAPPAVVPATPMVTEYVEEKNEAGIHCRWTTPAPPPPPPPQALEKPPAKPKPPAPPPPIRVKKQPAVPAGTAWLVRAVFSSVKAANLFNGGAVTSLTG